MAVRNAACSFFAVQPVLQNPQASGRNKVQGYFESGWRGVKPKPRVQVIRPMNRASGRSIRSRSANTTTPPHAMHESRETQPYQAFSYTRTLYSLAGGALLAADTGCVARCSYEMAFLAAMISRGRSTQCHSILGRWLSGRRKRYIP